MIRGEGMLDVLPVNVAGSSTRSGQVTLQDPHEEVTREVISELNRVWQHNAATDAP